MWSGGFQKVRGRLSHTLPGPEVEYYTAMKNEILSFTVQGTGMEDTVLRETAQKRKGKDCVCSVNYGSKTEKTVGLGIKQYLSEVGRSEGSEVR